MGRIVRFNVCPQFKIEIAEHGGFREELKRTGAMFASPVIAPWPFTKADGSKKSTNPPSTRKGKLGFVRGCADAKEGVETVAQMRVSFPTFPQVSFTPARFGQELARSVMSSESKSIPPAAPGSGKYK